ncbi:MAG: CYTH domain-containing protein [Lentisphaerae bacterium]|nr:CYTH domain-containing protein [Lentisphaerota bacterium]
MGCEIERKFLVDPRRWQPEAPGVKMVQCYLVRSEKLTLRLRLAGEQAFLTIKGPVNGISRSEFEYPIPRQDAMDMLREFNPDNCVSKVRYYTQVGQHRWEVDVFEGKNHGLITAEIELNSEAEEFVMPDWATMEVSSDPRYRNACLAVKPFAEWKSDGKSDDGSDGNMTAK